MSNELHINALKDIHFGASIPVIRMFEETEAKAFYLEFLGFKVNFEHRFNDNSPLYMEIELGQSTVHLDGHADKNSPESTVRITVKNIEHYHEYLKNTGFEYSKDLELVRPRATSLEMPINDPFGNLIIFWER